MAPRLSDGWPHSAASQPERGSRAESDQAAQRGRQGRPRDEQLREGAQGQFTRLAIWQTRERKGTNSLKSSHRIWVPIAKAPRLAYRKRVDQLHLSAETASRGPASHSHRVHLERRSGHLGAVRDGGSGHDRLHEGAALGADAEALETAADGVDQAEAGRVVREVRLDLRGGRFTESASSLPCACTTLGKVSGH